MGSIFFKTGKDKLQKVQNSGLWDIDVVDIDFKKKKMKDYLPGKKAFIFVNVASSWGLTSTNYKQLVSMYSEYADKGLEILAFPCNQFMSQESGSEAEIKNGVTTEYGVKFPLFAKIDVNGQNTHPVYQFLKFNTKELNAGNNTLKNIPWNFAKFLVDSKGKVVSYYGPKVEPKDIEKDMKNLLI